MTLARFRASNHPQQPAKRGPRPEVDDRQLPRYFMLIWGDPR